jgi:hypothetical protein
VTVVVSAEEPSVSIFAVINLSLAIRHMSASACTGRVESRKKSISSHIDRQSVGAVIGTMIVRITA